MARLQAIVSELKAVTVVVGMPYELDGSEGRSARLARQVGDALGSVSGVPVHYQDDRYSTVVAEERLRAAGHSAARRKQTIDQAAAAVILGDFFASRALQRSRAIRKPRSADRVFCGTSARALRTHGRLVHDRVNDHFIIGLIGVHSATLPARSYTPSGVQSPKNRPTALGLPRLLRTCWRCRVQRADPMDRDGWYPRA